MGWSLKFFPIYFLRLLQAFCEERIWWIISNYVLEFHLIIHLLIQQMFTVHFLWARARIEWWVISDTGPSLMEFAVCCNSQDISQKPCCIIVSNTVTIIKFIVISHWEAGCPQSSWATQSVTSVLPFWADSCLQPAYVQDNFVFQLVNILEH